MTLVTLKKPRLLADYWQGNWETVPADYLWP